MLTINTSGQLREKEFKQSSLRTAFDGAINIYVEPEDADIYSVVKKQSIPLGDIAEVKDGIIQGAVADLLFIDEPRDEYSHKILFGVDIARYKISWGGKYVNYNTEELMKTEIERRGPKVRPGLWMRNSGIFERKKILTRQTADRIIGAIDVENYYYANTLHGTSLNEEGIKRGYSLEFILALINSKLINYLYAVITGEAGKVFAQIKIETLKRLPIYSLPGNKTNTHLSELAKEATTKTSNEQMDILNEIDQLIFKLYGLEKSAIEYVSDRAVVFFGE